VTETNDAPSASGTVYLFGDRFAGKARLGAETLVYGGTKVNRKDLANQLLLSALVQLASEGYLQMERVERKKMGILTERDVQVTRSGEPKKPLHGLEAAIWENVSDDPKEDAVTKIVSRTIYTTSANPWGIIVDKAKEGLLEQDYLATEKEARRFRPDKVHWSANDELIAPHEGKVDEVKAMLASFGASDPALYKQLVDSVKKGIQSMYESPDDSDFDFD